MGSLKWFFDGTSFWAPICQNLTTSLNFAYLVPQSVNKHYFYSDPISVDPICPKPRPAPAQRGPRLPELLRQVV